MTNTEPANLQPEVIHFPNGHHATVVSVTLATSASAIINALGLIGIERLIVLTGSAAAMDAKHRARVCELLSRGVARTAGEMPKTVILDGGTKAGVMELMGLAIAERPHRSFLLGVAPAGKVSYPGHAAADPNDAAALDPNHSHFVLVECDDWGGETALMFRLADALAKGRSTGEVAGAGGPDATQPSSDAIPLITVLVQGNPDGVSVQEVLATVRRGWSLLVVESRNWWDSLTADLQARQDDHGLADLIAQGYRHQMRCNQRRTRTVWRLLSHLPGLRWLTEFTIADPALSEIITLFLRKKKVF